MRHPAYPLRPNKAVDRFAMIEAIRRLGQLVDLRKYIYYGLGGPYLEDFRLLYEFFPEIGMVSVEEDEETLKQQKFHRPSRRLKLEMGELSTFLTEYQSQGKGSIFWLDYTILDYHCFDEFMMLLQKVSPKSMVKITLRSNPRDFRDKSDDFRTVFSALMPHAMEDPPGIVDDFAFLLQQMVEKAAQTALPVALPYTFRPVSSFCYSDSVGMFTLTGVVWPRSEVSTMERIFRDWEFANLNWKPPTRIEVPFLSTKERLHLQHYLPRGGQIGRTLRKRLGYLIEENESKTEAALEQYAAFHRYSPYFLRGVP